ncbi:hypothetical protein SO802_016008 [Lithocarpus litseifolius]|uniref:Peroxisomal and mitochondrial division factor 2-like n=1 Tax=Lithocarpus litseifolius TaxID=425828 RepID=A0AAW2CVA4_9ROSI
MADKEIIINGAESDQTGESFYDLDQRGGGGAGGSDYDARVSELNRKIESLEREKVQLVNENSESKERIKKLSFEIGELRNDNASKKEKLGEMEKEIERSGEELKALESVARRAVELETEVSRMQHDLISTMSESEEANKEASELKRALGEKGERVERLEIEVESLKKEKLESEKRVRELERKVGVLEMKEVEEKSKKVRIEEEMREKIDEKEREIGGFRKKVQELESVVAKNGAELEKWMREKLGLEESLRESDEKAKVAESMMLGLKKEVEEAERVISGLKEKAAEAINGSVNGVREFVVEGEKKSGLKLDWLVVAGSTGAIAFAAAAAFVIYARRR